MKNDRMKNDRMKNDRMKNDRMKNDRMKNDRMKGPGPGNRFSEKVSGPRIRKSSFTERIFPFRRPVSYTACF